jgi:nucleotide-binding universal stress UspA family protein
MRERVVVVGVDGSPASYNALRWALSYSRYVAGRVRAIRCWMPVLARVWEATLTDQPVPPISALQAQAERELADVVTAAVTHERPSPTVTVEQEVIRGPAGPALVAQASAADLLVVGHARRLVEIRHRSVSWYCVRHAGCPVVVVPPPVGMHRLVARGPRGTLAIPLAGGSR